MSLVWTLLALALALGAVAAALARRLHAARGHAARLGSRLASVLAGDSVGLAVWNAAGRLVACNPRFRDFYPGTPLRPGLEMEDLLRFTAARGLIQAPDDQVESWVGARLAGLREASRDVVRTADGRWLDIRIAPSDHGEVLMLYVDVTGARDAGAALADRDRELASRTADRDLLQRALDAASAAGSFESAARQVNGLVCRWAGWPVGHAYRAAPDGSRRLDPVPEAAAIDGDDFEPLRPALARERPSAGDGLAGRVMQSGRVIWVANVESDPTFSAERRASMPGIRGACGVPVTCGTQAAAVLEFLSREPLVPSDSATRMLAAVGRILGSVLDR